MGTLGAWFQAVGELAEAKAEILALRLEPGGEINEHWAVRDEQIGEGWIRIIPGKNPDDTYEGLVVMLACKDHAVIWRYTGVSDLIDVNERIHAGSVREAMRLAEERARKMGLIP